MKPISLREIAARLDIAWRTVRERVLDGTIPGKLPHPTHRRGWVVDRKTFEKWARSKDR